MRGNTKWIYGKHVLITGASDGIGRELCRNLAGECRKLTLVSRRKDRLQLLKQELESSGTNIDVCPMDICNIEEIRHLIFGIYEKLHEQVDVFINCAGGSHVIGPFENMHPSDIAQIFDTNARAPIFWLRELLCYMKSNSIKPDEKKRGHIMMMVSRSSERPLSGLSIYASAKGAIEKLVEALQKEYVRHRLVFTLVAPGSINTSFTASWSKEDRDAHNAEAMAVEEAVLPIIQALNVHYATNRISYESTAQWLVEPGVLNL
uniref:3-hydroxy acid dehydrogenase / malonic semialdehyde reductase n=1 Tax=Candidatus Kentrum sp. SD TaxID=2126332 RepID=A0A450Y5S5_9GAMM|nr:MAG: 3-hydroxy acid dehydrogenase / malonic semialdehyde reductase [Candidatus Kentron sp. SD]VFK40526.1 MAG: 3-hydroxy acid dehydrogenase / malonic semialdehyde reductase [Candidatus Kentron sp. SD]VFK78371.1 MAG: 3-hydroxy acid dehydrogenase / malonic semialdehyde reductase [Candidatus Kentron sp. SD]